MSFCLVVLFFPVALFFLEAGCFLPAFRAVVLACGLDLVGKIVLVNLRLWKEAP